MENNHSDLKSGFDSFLKSVADAITDLATLEVNSVVVHNISADHPHHDREFLYQTCTDLANWFEKNRTDPEVQQPLKDDSMDTLRELRDQDILIEKDGKAAFGGLEGLPADIDDCLKHKQDKLNDAQRYKSSEYRRHLRYLQKYVELHNSSNWDSSKSMLVGREHQQLRKLWELVATDFVYAQTVVGLDGDVVSRVNQQLFDTAQKIVSDNAEELMHFHSRNVETGANYRNSLMVSLVQIVKGFLGR